MVYHFQLEHRKNYLEMGDRFLSLLIQNVIGLKYVSCCAHLSQFILLFIISHRKWFEKMPYKYLSYILRPFLFLYTQTGNFHGLNLKTRSTAVV